MILPLSPERARWLRDLPSRSALKVLNERRVRGWLGRRHAAAIARHDARLPPIDGAGQAIVDRLERCGVCITTLDALAIPGSEALVETAAALAQAFAPEARALSRAGQAFIIVPPADIAANPRIFHWGLEDRLLDIAERYIGLPAAYDGVAINYTVADGREISTRKWHRDWEDRRMLKVAVYLHDVDTGGGPFECIARQDTVQSDREGYNYDLADDDALARRLGEDFARDVVSCTGPRGTVVFCDTARFFHRGKPATTRDRAALFYSYFANPPRHPFLCERTGLGRADALALAEGLPERQRRAALWRGQLSPLLRMIPSASL
ncbi:hypothetical protein [Novosphingobium resinovorum]|uniref:hypothetical protein n=1 Tax=Novosphingobium resinovorum TaxID=158500 RepID=UPI002ECFC7A8|nr:hypothetical protein [Novosphingobium resinovorum]